MWKSLSVVSWRDVGESGMIVREEKGEIEREVRMKLTLAIADMAGVKSGVGKLVESEGRVGHRAQGPPFPSPLRFPSSTARKMAP